MCRDTRLVFIVDQIERDEIARTFQKFVGPMETIAS